MEAHFGGTARGKPAASRYQEPAGYLSSSPNEWYRWSNDLRKNPDIKILLSIDSSSFPLGTGPKYMPLPPPPKPGPLPPNLSPRCDDTIFKARGECIDSSAGPRGIPREETLPENLKSAAPDAHSRELLFIRDKDLSVVASPAPLSGPVIYEFRLAHR